MSSLECCHLPNSCLLSQRRCCHVTPLTSPLDNRCWRSSVSTEQRRGRTNCRRESHLLIYYRGAVNEMFIYYRGVVTKLLIHYRGAANELFIYYTGVVTKLLIYYRDVVINMVPYCSDVVINLFIYYRETYIYSKVVVDLLHRHRYKNVQFFLQVC